MKKLIFVLVFLLTGMMLYAGEYIFYTLRYPVTYTILSATIVSSECPADGKCFCMVSVSYMNKDAIRNPENNTAMILLKVTGFLATQDPIITFKQDSFARYITVDPYTTTQTY